MSVYLYVNIDILIALKAGLLVASVLSSRSKKSSSFTYEN
nr:MAG TPA: hypothetical protein [Caudoviricetes sp.]